MIFRSNPLPVIAHMSLEFFFYIQLFLCFLLTKRLLVTNCWRQAQNEYLHHPSRVLSASSYKVAPRESSGQTDIMMPQLPRYIRIHRLLVFFCEVCLGISFFSTTSSRLLQGFSLSLSWSLSLSSHLRFVEPLPFCAHGDSSTVLGSWERPWLDDVVLVSFRLFCLCVSTEQKLKWIAYFNSNAAATLTALSFNSWPHLSDQLWLSSIEFACSPALAASGGPGVCR